MADCSSSFRARYGQAIPAELHEIARFESIAREGGLSGLLGDVALITEAVALDRPIETGIENMLVFMWVNQPRHVDYYCFRKAGDVPKIRCKSFWWRIKPSCRRGLILGCFWIG